MKQGFFNNKKFKIGAIAWAFCAIIIAIVIVFNSIVSVLGEELEWYVDMTDERIYTVSNELFVALEAVDKDIDVEIIFCCTKDVAEKNYSNLESGQALAYVHSTAEQIAQRCENVTISYHDPIKEPTYFNDNFDMGRDGRPAQGGVVVARRGANGKFGTQYRAYKPTAFYVNDTDGNLYGYRGEYVFARAIISLTYDETPVVYFTANHSERLTNEKGTDVASIVKLFTELGFDARTIDLSESVIECECGAEIGEFSDGIGVAYENKRDFTCPSCKKIYGTSKADMEKYDTMYKPRTQMPNNARMVVINQPQSDLIDTEATLLRKYLDVQGSLMIFVDPDIEIKDKQPELYDFVESWAGVSIHTENRVVDYSKRPSGSQSDYIFKADMADNIATDTYVPNIGTIQPIIENSGILTINPDYLPEDDDNDSGYNDGTNMTRETLPLIVTSSSAIYDDGNDETEDRDTHTIMTVSYSYTIKGGEHDYYSRMIVCASGGFAKDSALNSNAYANKEIVASLVHSTTGAQVPVSIDIVPFSDYSLDITDSQAQVLLCVITFVPCLMCAVIGFVIIHRRKRR